MTTAAFLFRFQTPFRLAGLPLGVRSDTTGVEITGDELLVRFGPWRVRTDLANVASATVTGPYSWPKVIGPPHLSLSDRGLTFATNSERGVCVQFREPVAGLDPWGLLRHPAITLTVADTAALAELLDRSNQDTDRVPVDDENPSVEDLLDAVHDDLMALSAAELRRRARERGIPGASRRSKAELVDLLQVGGEAGR
jgi:hypothetical protein